MDHLSRGGSRAKTTELSLCQELLKDIHNSEYRIVRYKGEQEDPDIFFYL